MSSPAFEKQLLEELRLLRIAVQELVHLSKERAVDTIQVREGAITADKIAPPEEAPEDTSAPQQQAISPESLQQWFQQLGLVGEHVKEQRFLCSIVLNRPISDWEAIKLEADYKKIASAVATMIATLPQQHDNILFLQDMRERFQLGQLKLDKFDFGINLRIWKRHKYPKQKQEEPLPPPPSKVPEETQAEELGELLF